jgi:hypothetical protein
MAKRVLLDIHTTPAWYTLAGISCHLRDYRLSYLLNETLGFHLVKLEDMPYLAPGAKNPESYSIFAWSDDDQYNTYFLLPNRNEDSWLVPQNRQADFLLLIEGPFKKKQEDELLSRIRRVPNILTAFPISFATVKNYESILTDLELHINDLAMIR